MNSRLGIFLLAATLLVTPACGQRKLAPTQPGIDAGAALERPEAELDHGRRHGQAAQIIGRKDGAIYALYRPARWNGDLIVYAHGYIPPFAPIALPTNDAFAATRDQLLAQRYAVAVSSWSENGFAVKDAIEQTDRLRRLFADRLGRPDHVYLFSVSLGGLAALALAEREHSDYDGALMLSPPSAGSLQEIAYIGHVRVLFDTFYPGVLRGDLLHQPADLDVNRDVIGAAVAAMQADPRGALALSQIVQSPLPFRDANELVSSIVQALVYHAIELGDLLQRTGGGSFFHNADTRYAGALPAPVLADVNARVARYRLSLDAALFMRRYYEPKGRPDVPVLALYNAWDPVVPIFNQTSYRDRVAARGQSRRLVQRVYPRYGHVGFQPEEAVAAFGELALWARKHVRPRDTVAPSLVRQPVASAEMQQRLRSGVTLAPLEYAGPVTRRP